MTPSKREKRLLEGLDEWTGHADEAATLLPEELDPELRLEGSVLQYVQPFEPLEDWENWSDESPSDDQS